MAIFTSYILLLILSISILSTMSFSKYVLITGDIRIDKFRWRYQEVFLILFLSIFIGFRDLNLGNDFIGYVEAYESLNIDINNFYYYFRPNEIGYSYFNLLFSKLEIPYEVFFTTISCLILIFIFRSLDKFKYLTTLTIFFIFSNGFFFFMQSGIRQSIAISIFLFSIIYIIEKKFIRYIVCILIASTFHQTVLLVLPIYFISHLNFRRDVSIILFLLSNIQYVQITVYESIYTILEEFVLKLDRFAMYSHYLESEKMLISLNSLNTGIGIMIRNMAIIFIIYKSKYIISIQPKIKIYYMVFFIGVLFSSMFSYIQLIARFSYYFSICFPIVLAATVYFSDSRIEKIISFIIIILFFLLYCAQVYRFIY